MPSLSIRVVATQNFKDKSDKELADLVRGVVQNGGANAYRALEIYSKQMPSDGTGAKGLCDQLLVEYADEVEQANLRRLVARMDSKGIIEETYAPLQAVLSEPRLRPVCDAWQRLPSQFRIETDAIGDSYLVWPTAAYGIAGHFRTAQFVPDLLRHHLAKSDAFLGREYHYVEYTSGDSAGLPHPRPTRMDPDSGIIQLPVPQLPSLRVSPAWI